jgi:glucose-6-phosphate 1-dehydrogenase
MSTAVGIRSSTRVEPDGRTAVGGADALVVTRQDGVEQCWRVMQPLLDHPPPVRSYARGSWGPKAAGEVLAGYESWQQPWVVT